MKTAVLFVGAMRFATTPVLGMKSTKLDTKAFKGDLSKNKPEVNESFNTNANDVEKKRMLPVNMYPLSTAPKVLKAKYLGQEATFDANLGPRHAVRVGTRANQGAEKYLEQMRAVAKKKQDGADELQQWWKEQADNKDEENFLSSVGDVLETFPKKIDLNPGAKEFEPINPIGETWGSFNFDVAEAFEVLKEKQKVATEEALPESPEWLIDQYIMSFFKNPGQEREMLESFQRYLFRNPLIDQEHFADWYLRHNKQDFSAYLYNNLREETRNSIIELDERFGLGLAEQVARDLSEFTKECDGNCPLISILVKGYDKLVPIMPATN